MAQAPQKPCDICEQSPGNHFCLQCEQVFCNTCKMIHKKQKVSNSHEFQLASEPITEVKSKCKDHDETFSFFCATCNVPVCGRCITDNHQGHRISDVQKTVKEIKQILDKELKPKVEYFENSAEHVIKEINRVENEGSAVIQSVKEEANRLKAAIDRHADQLISFVKSDVDEEKARLKKNLDDIKMTMATAKSVDDQKKALDKNRPDGHLLGELKSLLDSMEKMTINPLSNAVSVKYIPPTETFQVEEVMGKYLISGDKQNENTERRRTSYPFHNRHDRREEKKTRYLCRCENCGGCQPHQQQFGGPQGGKGGWDGGGWGGNNFGDPQGGPGGYQQPQPQQSDEPNQSKQANDNAAAWAAYYAKFYDQTPYAAAINPQTGKPPDYSAAWAEYYRQQGMFTQAQTVLQQAAAMQAQGGTHQPTQPPQ